MKEFEECKWYEGFFLRLCAFRSLKDANKGAARVLATELEGFAAGLMWGEVITTDEYHKISNFIHELEMNI